MTGDEFRGQLDSYTPTQMRAILEAIWAYDDMLFTRAHRAMRRATSPGHGENHIGSAGQVVSACAPGECITCHGTVDAAGVFTPAGAA